MLRCELLPVPRRLNTVDYQRHQPENTLLHEVIRDQLETFLANARQRGAPVARFVEREFRAYLDCGVLAHGFLRLHCDACGHDRLLAFSCRGRGVCTSCAGRRMADTAAHLVDRVIPHVPVRQWVLTLPYPLRYRMAWDAKLTSEVLRCFMRALFADQRRRARHHHGVQGGATTGAVTAIQRFGSALNLTPHFHTLVLDGVYPGPSHDPGSFLPLPPPSTEDVARVMAGTAMRIARLLEKRRLEGEDDPLAADHPLLATLFAASIRSRIATGPEAGQPWRRLGDRVDLAEHGDETGKEPGTKVPPRCVRQAGMSLHAGVAVPARDRRRLERLCRYVLRPAMALERLEALPSGLLAYRLKTRWRDGTTHILMERRELLERLAPLIPPPRAHQVRYHGILAPCAAGRSFVVPARTPAVASVPPMMGAVEPQPQPGLTSSSGTRGADPGRGERGRAIAGSPAGVETKQVLPVLAGAGAALAPAPRPAAVHRTGTGSPAVSPRARSRRLSWSELLKRVFGIDALGCLRCGSTMRVMATITDPDVARRILACMKLPPRALPLAGAPSSSPLDRFDTNEAPALVHSSSEAEFDFDQTPPHRSGSEGFD
ncbi:MAG: hypothetical protein GY944_15150 [bacterium]|nr:hypothetical protein [bacterium]